ncbi:F0F1 ATP synthase subunit A [Candidatus Saccharibacteria bacterium]|nr:F0F1 ATP synthase subunit A [Candidatus Saccharibacteria bacterium]
MFAAAPTVSLPSQTLISVFGVPIHNSMILGAAGIIILFWLMFYTRKRVLNSQHTKLSIAMLWGYEMLTNTTEEVLGNGDKALARKIAPLAVTLFFLILLDNWLELLPIVGPVTFHGEGLFRGMAADLNFTFALAIITMVTAQLWAIKNLGFFGNLGRYFGNPFKDPLHCFIGFLELIAEFSRLIALSMRLFGNIFGGEVLLAVIAYISGYASPLALPVFLALELFVGAIQAYIFFMLTVAFISIGATATKEHGEEATTAIGEARAV